MVLLAIVILCLSGMAKDRGESWVMTRDGKMDCKKVNLRFNKARIVLENGQKNLVAFSTISSFSQNGKLFTKLRLYDDGKPTRQMAFMELIKTCGNLSLYRLGFCDLGSYNPNNVTYHYFLYDRKKLHLTLDERMLRNICFQFGVNYADL